MTLNDIFLSPVKLSIEIASFSLLIVLIVRVLTAKVMANRTFKWKSIIATVLLLPPSVVGFLLIVVFGKQSFLGQLIESVFK